MKVCVITPSFYPAIIYGGPIISSYFTCVELAKIGVEVDVATTNANGNKKLKVEANRTVRIADRFLVKYYDDNVIGRFSWRFVAEVWRNIRKCDLVRVEDIFSTYIPPSLLYAKLFRKPVCLSARGALSRWALGSKRPLAKKIWLTFLINPLVRNVWWHATSEQEKLEILELYPMAKVVVIPNGIDVKKFNKSWKLSRIEYIEKFAKLEGRPNKIIVSMGRLHKVKGFSLLLDAFAGLLVDFEDSVLLIAGPDAGERKNLENHIARLTLGGKVFLIGEVNGHDKMEFLAGADLFVLPSYSENFGNVYLEAMASGLPIVASKGTPWEQVERIGCGKWVECSVDAVRSAMHGILTGDHGAMGQLAKEYALQLDWSNIAREFESLFAMMLGLPRLEMSEHSEIDHAEKIT